MSGWWLGLSLIAMVLAMANFFLAGLVLGRGHPAVLLGLVLIGLGALCNLAAHIATLLYAYTQLRRPHD